MDSNCDRIPFYGAFQIMSINQTSYYQFAKFMPHKKVNCSNDDCYKIVNLKFKY